MNASRVPIFPFDAVEVALTADDDRELWLAVTKVVVDDFMQKRTDENARKKWAMRLGACSHWERPHQTRWTAAGGFAYPRGYENGSPGFDWSVTLIFGDGVWRAVNKLPKKKVRVLRVAVPSRTSRRNQAAVHARWIPGVEQVLYGFRKIGGQWKCVAASDQKLNGILNDETERVG